MILESAKALYPRETIFLLRGKTRKNMVAISEMLVPPFATYGRGFSAFPTYMLPIDFSIVGTAHSHPSGNLTPSVGDLNHSFGRLILIVAFPYESQENMAAYNREGKKLTLHVT
jgi:proteasome lid subunit RPN8/RPN11